MGEFKEIMHMAATIYGEARGEYFPGKVAVGWVIMNRAKNPGWWGKDVVSVCRKDKQFSCWNDNDPNSMKVKEIALTWRDTNILDDKDVQACLLAALKVYHGIAHDLTMGANHYHAESVRPKWAEGQTSIAAIGNHQFYKL